MNIAAKAGGVIAIVAAIAAYELYVDNSTRVSVNKTSADLSLCVAEATVQIQAAQDRGRQPDPYWIGRKRECAAKIAVDQSSSD